MRSKAALSPGADDDCSAGRPGARIRIPRRLAQFADFWSAKSMTLSSWGHKSPPPAVGYGKQGAAHVRSPTCYRITAFGCLAFASGLGFASSVRSLRVLQGRRRKALPRCSDGRRPHRWLSQGTQDGSQRRLRQGDPEDQSRNCQVGDRRTRLGRKQGEPTAIVSLDCEGGSSERFRRRLVRLQVGLGPSAGHFSRRRGRRAADCRRLGFAGRHDDDRRQATAAAAAAVRRRDQGDRRGIRRPGGRPASCRPRARPTCFSS